MPWCQVSHWRWRWDAIDVVDTVDASDSFHVCFMQCIIQTIWPFSPNCGFIMWLIYPSTATAVLTPAFVAPCPSPSSFSQRSVASMRCSIRRTSFQRQDGENGNKIWQASNGECKWKGHKQMLMLKAQRGWVITKHSSAFYLMPPLIPEVPSQRVSQCPAFVHLKGLFFIHRRRDIAFSSDVRDKVSYSCYHTDDVLLFCTHRHHSLRFNRWNRCTLKSKTFSVALYL